MNIIKASYVEIEFECDSLPRIFEVGNVVHIINNDIITKCQILEIIDNYHYEDEYGYVMVKPIEESAIQWPVKVNDIVEGERKLLYDEQCMKTGRLVSAQICSKYYYLDDFNSMRLLGEWDKCYLTVPSVKKNEQNLRVMNTLECRILSIDKDSVLLRSESLGYRYCINDDNKDKYRLTCID